MNYKERFEELKRDLKDKELGLKQTRELNIASALLGDYKEIKQDLLKLKEEIKANGCRKGYERYKPTITDWEICGIDGLCPQCKELIKQIDEVLK